MNLLHLCAALLAFAVPFTSSAATSYVCQNPDTDVEIALKRDNPVAGRVDVIKGIQVTEGSSEPFLGACTSSVLEGAEQPFLRCLAMNTQTQSGYRVEFLEPGVDAVNFSVTVIPWNSANGDLPNQFYSCVAR